MLKIGEIRELIRLLDETAIAELKIELDDMKLHLKKAEIPAPTVVAATPIPVAPAVQTAPVQASLPVHTPSSVVATPVVTESTTNVVDDSLYVVKSPMVGTFYKAPSPDKPAYAEKGTKVEPKSIVCIVEAMKLMNEIEAEVSGEVVEVLAQNGQLVEYGQPLFKIRLA